MPTKLYVQGSFVIAEDLATRTPFFKAKTQDVKHHRSVNDQFSFYPSEVLPNYSVENQPIQLIIPKVLDWDTQELEPSQLTYLEFADIVDINGAAYASADALDVYLDNNLGFILVKEVVPPVVTPDYFKDRVIVTTTSNNFNSNIPANVPGLTFAITLDGDYVFNAIVNNNNDQNEELEMYYAVNGATILDSVVFKREQKNQDDNIQGTYDIDGLVIGDVVTVQLDTRGDNVDLLTRRMIIRSWNLV